MTLRQAQDERDPEQVKLRERGACLAVMMANHNRLQALFEAAERDGSDIPREAIKLELLRSTIVMADVMGGLHNIEREN